MKERNEFVKAVYAGTFDPITNGHLDIVYRSLEFCDQLIIGVGINPDKKNMFSTEERIQQIQEAVYKKIGTSHVDVVSFQGLLVEFAKMNGVRLLVRGIRSVSDFEYEINLANINKTIAPGIETVFLPTRPELAVVSSSMVKELAKLGSDVTKFVPEHIAKQVSDKFGFIKHGKIEIGTESINSLRLAVAKVEDEIKK
jgi:pantetheine-phosphate adenylyltransferase